MKRKTILTLALAALLVVSITACATAALPSAYAAQSNKEDRGSTNIAMHNSSSEQSEIPSYAEYEKYDLTYKQAANELYYKGELVRYFEDYYPLENNAKSGIEFFNENGTIDVHGVRDFSQATTTNPSGTLTGLKPYTQAEFAARDIEELKKPYQKSTTVMTDEAPQMVNGKMTNTEGTTTITSGMTQEEARNEAAKQYSAFEKYGLVYNKTDDRLYYKDKLVRYFEDILKIGATDYSRFMTSSHEDGEVDVYTIFDEKGNLAGIEPFSQAEFDARTDSLKNRVPFIRTQRLI